VPEEAVDREAVGEVVASPSSNEPPPIVEEEVDR